LDKKGKNNRARKYGGQRKLRDDSLRISLVKRKKNGRKREGEKIRGEYQEMCNY